MREWLTADREFLRAHRRLTDAATEWDQHSRDEAYLYRGALLATWQDREQDALNEMERAFLAASVAHQDREKASRRRRLKLTLLGLGATVIVVSLLAVLALIQAVRAADERELAFSRQLAASARSQLEVDPQLALLLAIKAVETRPTAEADAVLRQAVVDSRIRAIRRADQGEIRGVAFSPDGRRVATGGHQERANGIASSQGQIAYTPDGRYIVTTSTDGIRIWDPSGQQDTALLQGHVGIVLSLSIAPDGHAIASGSQDGTIRINTPSSDANALVLRGHRGEVWGVAFSPDSRKIASAGADGTLRLWSATLPGDPQVLRGHDGPTWCATFAPDGSQIVSGGQDGTVRIWDADRGQRAVFHGHTDEILDVAFSPNRKQIASTSLDGTTRIWDTIGKDAPLVLTEDEERVWSVAFSPDSRRVAISTDQAVHLRVIAGNTDSDMRLARGVFRQVAFSPDGRLVAGAGTDGTVRIWNADEGSAPLVLPGHQGKVFSVRFAPDGKHLASGGHDGTVRLWKTARNAEPIMFHGYRASVETVTFSPQGHRLLTTHDDGTVRLQHCETCGSLDNVLALAKTRAIRSLTPEETQRFGIDEHS